MTLLVAGGRAELSGVCTVEEALEFHEFIVATPAPVVDLTGCTYLHTALLQVLIAARPEIAGLPGEPALARWIGPMLTGGDARWITRP